MEELDLGKEKIGKLLLKFAIPCIISMLINSIYNIVDQIFIGKGVGSLGNAATNVIFPIVIICNRNCTISWKWLRSKFKLIAWSREKG